MKHSIIAAAGLALAATASYGQVVINEVWENPAGAAELNDEVLEYIELYGKPGMDLTGYAIGLFKGGLDGGGLFGPENDVPDTFPELDECIELDGLVIGANGFLVVHTNTDSQSAIPDFVPAQTTVDSWWDHHIPIPGSSEGAGKLENDGSSTYILMRKRRFHSIVNGVSVYEPGYAVHKDRNHDVDFDGKLDFGIEAPINNDLGVSPGPSAPVFPIQIIDSIAWSNGGGKEYVNISEYEISDTPGFNPDMVSRVAYYGSNPMRGSRINSSMETVPTRIADEEFIYGENLVPSILFAYDPTQYGAPTDPSGDGFTDISIGTNSSNAFKLTPGDFNDSAVLGITQFRFVEGDLDFDGDADADDLALFDSTLFGADFDATEDYIDNDTNMPIADPNNPGQNFQTYVFQDRLANAYLAAACLSELDGTDVPGADDRAALVALVGGEPCPADLNGDTQFDFFDISFLLQNQVDFNGDTGFDFFDISAFLQAGASCP
jgi:hypothetical protein